MKNKYKKDFDRWNEVKKDVDNKYSLAVKVGEICWCNFGLNIGKEQNGDIIFFARPVIIIHVFSKELVLVAPLTTRIKSGSWYLDIFILHKHQQVILSQIKPIDTKRIIKIVGQISEKETLRIKREYKDLFS